MRFKHILIRGFIYFVILVVGIIIGITIRHYHNIPLSQEINIIDLAALLVTIFLAVYIPEVLDHKLQNTRDKKSLLERRIVELQGLLRSVNAMVQNDELLDEKACLKIQNVLDISDNKWSTIVSLLGYARFGRSFEDQIGEIERLVKEHAQFLERKEKSSTGFAYSSEIKLQEEQLYNKIDMATSLLIFQISDS